MLVKPDESKIEEVHFKGEGENIQLIPTRKLDYYQVYALPYRLCIDQDSLRNAFLKMARKAHPDYYAAQGEEAQKESLKKSSLFNNAYKTLRNDQLRAEYLMGLSDLDIQSNKQAIPPTLLEEIFEIQEAGEHLKQARLSSDSEKLEKAEKEVAEYRKMVKEEREKIVESLQKLFQEHDKLAEEGSELKEIYGKIRLALDQNNYLRTVYRNLK